MVFRLRSVFDCLLLSIGLKKSSWAERETSRAVSNPHGHELQLQSACLCRRECLRPTDISSRPSVGFDRTTCVSQAVLYEGETVSGSLYSKKFNRHLQVIPFFQPYLLTVCSTARSLKVLSTRSSLQSLSKVSCRIWIVFLHRTPLLSWIIVRYTKIPRFAS